MAKIRRTRIPVDSVYTTVKLSRPLLKRVEDFAFDRIVMTRCDALRHLIRVGLDREAARALGRRADALDRAEHAP